MRRYPDPDLASIVTATAGNLPNARTLTAGNHITLADAGAGAALTADWRINWRRVSLCFSDMNSAGDWTTYLGGTGAANTFGIAGDGNRMGILQSSTGTTTTGYAGIGSAAVTDIVFGTREHRLAAMCRTQTLSTVTERYYAIIGFFDRRNSLTATDGVHFVYSDALGANWQTTSISNTTTLGYTDTGVVADTSWHAFEIVVNSAGTQALCYIDGTLVATESTIPTGAARATAVSCHIIKSAGTTARTMDIDLLACQVECQR